MIARPPKVESLPEVVCSETPFSCCRASQPDPADRSAIGASDHPSAPLAKAGSIVCQADAQPPDGDGPLNAAPGGSDGLERSTNLSAVQFLVWAGQQLYPSAPVYNVPALMSISGDVDREHFRRAFQALVDSHDVLRTVVTECDGFVRQQVVAEMRGAVEYLDFSAEEDPDAVLDRWVTQRSRRLFDLRRCLFDPALIRLGDCRMAWYLNQHQLITDGWSLSILVRRMCELYGRSVEGGLGEQPVYPQYGDYLEQERAFTESGQYQADKAYWTEKLSRPVERLTFYGRDVRLAVAEVARERCDLGKERTRRLVEMARRPGIAGRTLHVSVFNIFAGLYAAFLQRISGSRRLLVGTPFMNRPAGYRETAGLFMQAAPLFLQVTEGATLLSLVLQARSESEETARHTRHPIRNRGGDAYQVLLNYHNRPAHPSMGGATVDETWLHPGAEVLALSLQVLNPDISGGTFSLAFDFRGDVFSCQQRKMAVQHFLRLVDSFLDDPATPVDRVQLLSAEEQEQLLSAFGRGQPLEVGHICLHQLFEAQAERTPAGVAVWFEREHLTYRQLDRQASLLACQLTGLGVGPEVPVAVCMERSLEWMVGVLGVLKAGGAYLPLDPDYPVERAITILRASRAPVLLTQKRLQERLPDLSIRVICLDPGDGRDAVEPAERPDAAVDPENPACLIVTSGSTGEPKTIVLSHRALASRMAWGQAAYGYRETDRVLLQNACSFDYSIWEMFTAWTAGAGLVMTRPGGHLDGVYLADLIQERQVTVAGFVPSMLRLFLETPYVQRCTSLRDVYVGGEALTPDLLARFRERLLCRLINIYGPAEATIYVTHWCCASAGSAAAEVVPIGQAVGNTRLYVLDARLQPVPVGVAGELCIGGAPLARGYLGQPMLTAKVFVPDPYRRQAGARLYRTGDLARFLPDGNLQFLGRLDHQVKVRGFRVELEAIEVALSRHERVRSAAVVAPMDGDGGRRLVAFVVAAEEPAPTRGDLRAFLKRSLPDPMVPSLFVLQDRLPRTASGKVNRQALAVLAAELGTEPSAARSLLDGQCVPPRTPVEIGLAMIWAEVLGIDGSQVGVEDNFFDLGGHSLLATRVIARLVRDFRVSLPLRSLFENPTISGLARLVERSAALTEALGGSMAGLDSGPPSDRPLVRRVPRVENVPLSYAQQRLWFLGQLQPGSVAYNMPQVYRLTGRLDQDALAWSVQQMVRRHEALRTTFGVVDGKAAQLIAPAEAGLPLEVVDLRGLPSAGARESEALRRATQVAYRPFDPGAGPLMRAVLFRLEDEVHVFVLVQHHIITDGWSQGILWRELTALYRARLADPAGGSPLQDLPIQYADFAVWQREWLQAGDVLEGQLAYWREQLAGAIPAELPPDRPRPVVQTFAGDSHLIRLPPGLRQGLARVSRQEQATLFMTLLAAFQLLLSRYTGQEDLVVGTPIANRVLPETEGLIGFFANTLALRCDLGGDPTFRELLRRVRVVCLAAYAHQDLPFERLVEELNPQRDLSRNPLFQVLFALQNAPQESASLAGLRVEPLPLEKTAVRFDLECSLWEVTQGIEGTLVYNADLYDSGTVARLAGHFRTLLDGIVADPDRPVSRLPLLSDDEMRRLVVEWNETDQPVAERRTVVEMVQEQVERFPEMAAVTCGGRVLSYDELNRRANQLAHYLWRLGVDPGSEAVVALRVERSLEMAVGLLGVLKSGAACLPLGPGLPADRLAFMLRDAGVGWLIAAQPLSESPEALAPRLVCLDRDRSRIAAEREIDPQPTPMPGQLAYVLYTSGSTGVPKGVAMEHRALRNLVCWQVEHSTAAAGSRTAQFSPLSFDVSFQEILSTWCSGGTLVMMEEETRRDPEALLRFLVDERIERLFLPFVALQSLAQAAGATGGPAHLREVITAGEQLRIAPEIGRWFGGMADCRLHNHYGPTESHVVTAFPLPAEPASWEFLPSIGRPISNVRIYLLDRNLAPVPPGVAGELHIGGDSLARGYHNRPGLTAERFVPNPFASARGAHCCSQPGSRLYGTGDLARYRQDGSIEYLGRRDNQVKIRGFRVEPGEIEAVLSQNPLVKEAAIAVRKAGASAEQQLVAYWVPTAGRVADTHELRSDLRQRLPEYMVPRVFVRLEALPLTRSGKVNRMALPEPEACRLEVDPTYVAPRTETEARLADIWAEVLGLERSQIGVHDSFFELGGHSLLATRVIARVRRAFQAEIPVRSLFECSTVASLAATLERSHSVQPDEQRGIPDRLDRHPIRPAPRSGKLPLSSAQRRLWFLDQLEPGSSAYHIAAAYRLIGRLKRQALEQSLAEVVRRHEALRTTFEAVDGEPQQVIWPPDGTVPVSWVDLRSLVEEERECECGRLLEEQGARPFDLSQGPLFRFLVARLRDDEHVFSLATHHVVSDGWSLGLFWREVAALYNAYANGRPSPLPELPIQYADYAVWQRERLDSGLPEGRLGPLGERLAGAAATEILPDRPRPAVQTFAGAEHEFGLSRELSQAVAALARQEDASLFMILLAAFQLLLSRQTGQEDVVVGSPIANRILREVEGLIGVFVNTLVLRTSLRGDLTFRELLRRVREVCLEAYAHQDIPFERLVQELQPQRDLSRTPLFQVVFALQNAPSSGLELAGLAAEPVRLPQDRTRFDLECHLWEGGAGLAGLLIYNTDLLNAATVERLAAHYCTLLEGIAAEPDQTIHALPVMTQAEWSEVAAVSRRPPVAFAEGEGIVQLFEAQAAGNPDATALILDGERTSYRWLNQRANQVGHRLRALGVGPGAIVGVCLERSPELAAGLLGVVKAGGAFLPLDPSYPDLRLAHMLADSGAAMLLTAKALAGRFAQFPADVICLDSDRAGIDRQRTENLGLRIAPDWPAYVIYTSGSTGQPKGMRVPHRQILNRFHWMWRAYPFQEGEVGCQRTPFSFVDSLWELLGYLLKGMPVVIVPDRVVTDLPALVQTLAEHRVSRIWLVPSLLGALLESCPDLQQQLPDLRFWVSSGEALPGALYRLFKQRMPRAVLHNLYGTSEAWDVSWYQPDDGTREPVPIGRPIANVEAWLLDSHWQPVPLDVPGELWVGGAGLAEGYLNRPALTAERFVPHPFGDCPGARLHRTGDLARYRPDGNLEFLGRLDYQVKVRGFRVEPGEIEAVLRGHPAVHDAAVVATAASAGDGVRLVGFLTCGGDPPPSAAELRRYLGDRLPEQMVPAAFAVVDSLPLTPSGKVDRLALLHLPDPSTGQPDAAWLGPEQPFSAPRTALEGRLAQIWAEVLGMDRERVGVHDNFFELGGHSLLGIRLFARIEQVLGFKMPVAALFRAPSVAQLAETIERDLGPAGWGALVTIQEGDARPPLFLVHGFGGGVIGYAGLARLLGPEQPAYGLQARGLDGRQEPHASAEEMAAYYLEAVKSVQPAGPYRLCGYCYGGVVAFEMARQLCERGEQVALLAVLEGYAPPGERERMHWWRPRVLARFLANLPGWVQDTLFRPGTADRLFRRLRGRVRAAATQRGWSLPPIGREWDEAVAQSTIDAIVGGPDGIPEEGRRVMLAHLKAMQDYRPAVFAGKVTLFRTRTLSPWRSDDPMMGWGRLAAGGVEVRMIPGAHYNILEPPYVKGLAVELAAALAASVDEPADVCSTDVR